MSNENKIIVNYLSVENRIFEIVPLKIHRDWMSETDEKYAYKCLPLNIANQYGWFVPSPFDFKVSWYGGSGPDDVKIFGIPEQYSGIVSSYFGHATFTINLDFIVKTPEKYSLYIRGMPNRGYQILNPLDAIVETDWLPFTFTYNFKFTDAGVVEFKKGDPLFSFFPIKRNTVENFKIISQSIQKDWQLLGDFLEYKNTREKHVRERYLDGYKFQKFYLDGRGPKKIYNIKNHIKRLFFKEVKEEDS